MLQLLPLSSVLGFPLYEDTANGRAATHQLYSFAIEFGLAPILGEVDEIEIYLSQFISSLFEGVGQLLPGNFAGLLMSRPCSSQLGTLVAKRCSRGFLEVYRVRGCSINSFVIY